MWNFLTDVLNVAMLRVVRLNVIRLNAIRLNVAASTLDYEFFTLDASAETFINICFSQDTNFDKMAPRHSA